MVDTVRNVLSWKTYLSLKNETNVSSRPRPLSPGYIFAFIGSEGCGLGLVGPRGCSCRGDVRGRNTLHPRSASAGNNGSWGIPFWEGILSRPAASYPVPRFPSRQVPVCRLWPALGTCSFFSLQMAFSSVGSIDGSFWQQERQMSLSRSSNHKIAAYAGGDCFALAFKAVPGPQFLET